MSLRIAIILLFASYTFHAKSQSDFSMSDYQLKDSVFSKVGLFGETMYNSNVLNNSVFYGSLFKTKITRKSFLKMENKAMKNNRAGNYQSDRVYTSWTMGQGDSNRTTHFFTINTKRFVAVDFPEDAFLLAGFGNKRFAGQKADASHVDLQLLQFTKLQYGQIRKFGNLVAGAGLSLNMGNRYARALTNEAYLYTSEIGDSISVRIDGMTIENDTSSKLIYDPNGWGAGLDFFVTVPLDLSKKNESQGTLTFEVEDLGFISWNSETLTREYDGSFQWPGIQAPSLFEVTDSIYQSQFPDTLQEQFLRLDKKESLTTFTPMRLALRYVEQLNSNMEMKAMLDYRFIQGYWPYVALTEKIRMSKEDKNLQTYLNAFQSLGGFGYAGLGVGIGLENKNFGFDLGTRHLFAMAVPESMSGFNVRLGFHWNFYSR